MTEKFENDYDREIDRLREEKTALVEACKVAQMKPGEVRKVMEDNDFVIDNLKDRWQKLAFTLYTIIVETATDAEAAIAQTERKDERVTYPTARPYPTE